MPTYGPHDAEVLVFTFKQGLLSAVAHDLKLRASSFEIDVDEEHRRVRATFDPASLRVVTAMRDGKENPSALSARDREAIEANIRDAVLHPSRFDEVRFESTAITGEAIAGELTLHGVTRTLSGRWRQTPEGRVAEFELHQPDFGVAPFKALMGTLKLQPSVKVRVLLRRTPAG